MATAAYDGIDATVVNRSDTGKRILLTIFFVIVARLVEAVLALVVLFELVYSLITKRRPNGRVTRFAHRLLCYGFDIGQYVTCNKDQLPFPLDEFSTTAEATGFRPAATQ